MSIPVVVLDACVLYPAVVRDMFLRGAEEDLLRPYWSQRILDEVTRNLVADGRMSARQADRLMTTMSDAFPEALVTGYQSIEPMMTNHPKDRHVVAAAVVAQADVIVTFNVRDFPSTSLSRFGLVAETPDQFLDGLIESAPRTMLGVIEAQAADLTAPPTTSLELINRLERLAPLAAGRLYALLFTATFGTDPSI